MAEDKMTLEDWLDDLCVRFIVNLGQADLSDTARICFQIEEAQWFYEDFIRPLDPQLPSMTLKQFSLKMFQHCPLFAGFSAQEHQMAFERFLQYKTRVPVRGAIMLNAAMDSAVLVRGYKKGASWSFPRGKINKDEDDLDCAVREVIEETGFDLRAAGLVARNAPVTPVEVTMKDQQVRLYVFRDVPEDTAFAPKTRKEIGAIQWYKLSDLPAFRKKKGKAADATSADRFYMVAPFMVQLRNWIKQQKKDRPLQISMDEALTDDNVFYPHASAQNTEVDHTTKELPNFAHAAPQVLTHGQHQTAGGQEAAAAHLMALLQPGLASAGMQQPQQHTQQQEERRQQLQFEIQQQELQVQQLHKQHMQQLQLQQHHLQQQIHQREQQQYQHQYQQYLKIEADKQQFAKQQYEQQQQQHAYAQRDRPMAGGQQPQSPHFYPQAQHMQAQEHGQPPPATNFSAPASGHSQYRHQRPQVEVPVPVHRQMVPPQNLQREPVQLVHPQPMPAPQVVSAMVNNYGGDYVQPRSKDVSGSQKQAQSGSASQAHLGSPSHPQGRAPAAPAPMPAHSMNLLNTLMGGASLGKSSGPQQIPQPHTAKLSQPSAQQQDGASLRQQPTSDFAPQVISGPETKHRNDASTFLPSVNPQGMNKHHSNLLDMFKVGGNTSPAGQSETRTTPQQTASHEEKHRMVQQPAQELPTMAHVMKTAAKENGQPIKMSSETNLPYGAVSILARPQADQKPAAKEMSAPAPLPAQPQSPLRPIREPRIGSRDSSGFPSTRSSPRQIQTQSQRQVAPSQLSPQSQALFGKLQQHGHTQSPLVRMQNQGSDPVRAKSPLSQVYSPGLPYDGLTGHSTMMLTPPSTTQLGVPNSGKVRRESTAEHKQSLLSLFGQPKTGSDGGPGKGKDLYTPEMYGTGAPPRSRVASVASSTGVGHGTANGSRRGSQSPMSSSDRNFLLGFLQTASNKAT